MIFSQEATEGARYVMSDFTPKKPVSSRAKLQSTDQPCASVSDFCCRTSVCLRQFEAIFPQKACSANFAKRDSQRRRTSVCKTVLIWQRKGFFQINFRPAWVYSTARLPTPMLLEACSFLPVTFTRSMLFYVLPHGFWSNREIARSLVIEVTSILHV